MKKIITLLFCITALLNGSFAEQVNLVANPGFEADVATFTVVENQTNVLMRAALPPKEGLTHSDAPTATQIPVTDGLWLKQARASSWLKGVVTTGDFKTGNSSLNLKMAPPANTPIGSFSRWSVLKTYQRLPAGTLNNTKKYVVTFWAKLDGTANNGLTSITPFLTVNGSNFANKAVTLTGGTTWTQYSATIDLPAFIAAEESQSRTHDFSGTAYFGLSFGTTEDENGNALYAGVLLDDIKLQVDTATELSSIKLTNSNHIFHLENDKVISNIEGNVSIYSVTGKLNMNLMVRKGQSISIKPGVYIIRLNSPNGLMTQKLIVC